MNKKLIALAVAGACVAPAAMAQTANPVTLYGFAGVHLESVEASGGATPVKRRQRVEDRVSRLGVRGTEDLGGGLKAFFQLETAFPADQNTNAGPGVTTATNNGFANRNSGVGLQGGFGSVLLGRWDTPMKIVAAGAVDPWGDVGLPDVSAASLGVGGRFAARWQNTIQYWSPSWGGLSVRLAYQANEGKTATLDPSGTSGSVAFARGPLYLAFAHERHNDVAAGVDEKGNVVAARFGFGPFRIMGNYGRFERTGTKNQKGFYLGADWTMGNNVLLLSYANAKDGGSTTAATQPDCKVTGIGYKYNFSRRTFFLVEYARVANNEAATCNFGQSALGGITAGQDPRGISAGFGHSF